jgi:hypothetical protein
MKEKYWSFSVGTADESKHYIAILSTRYDTIYRQKEYPDITRRVVHLSFQSPLH